MGSLHKLDNMRVMFLTYVRNAVVVRESRVPRPTKLRQVTGIPAVTFFKPAGVPMNSLEMVTLAFEEVEAIRLKDIEDLHQEECAQRMGISRATFHTVLKSARGKLADAILNGKAIQVQGGTVAFPGARFRCRRDGNEWTLPPGPLPGSTSVACPSCNGRDVLPVFAAAGVCGGPHGGGRGRGRLARAGWRGSWGPSPMQTNSATPPVVSGAETSVGQAGGKL
jgi:uncharacterized protein